MEESLELQEHRDGDVCIVHPVGEVDMQTMRPLREMVRRLPEEGVRYLVLDLSEVNFLDSAGMSILFGAKKRLAEDRGECYVITTEEGFVAKTLQMISLGMVMPHLHNLEQALEDVRQRKEGRQITRAEAAAKDREDRAVREADDREESGPIEEGPDGRAADVPCGGSDGWSARTHA